jgi:hypothetical protein
MKCKTTNQQSSVKRRDLKLVKELKLKNDVQNIQRYFWLFRAYINKIILIKIYKDVFGYLGHI